MTNVIAREDLKKGSWYVGHGRSESVAYWNGEAFLSIGFSCRSYGIDYMDYGERGFDPIQEIENVHL